MRSLMIRQLTILTFLMLFCIPGLVRATEECQSFAAKVSHEPQQDEKAIVTEGANLIERSGTHIGYLPVGTIIKIDGPKVTIGYKNSDIKKDYMPIVSEFGQKGYIHVNLFHVINPAIERIAVAIATLDPIPLFWNPPPPISDDEVDCSKDPTCIPVSRTDNIYLELLNKEKDGYHEVNLHRKKLDDCHNYQVLEKNMWLRDADLTNQKKMKLIANSSNDFNKWVAKRHDRNKSVNRINTHALLKTLCETETVEEYEGEYEKGIEFFKDNSRVWVEEFDSEGNEPTLKLAELYGKTNNETAKLVRTILCDKSLTPSNMLSLNFDGSAGTFSFSQEDIKSRICPQKGCQKYLQLNKQVIEEKPERFNRMFVVNGWDSYHQLYKVIDELLEDREIKLDNRNEMINFLIWKTAVFEKNKLVTKTGNQ